MQRQADRDFMISELIGGEISTLSAQMRRKEKKKKKHRRMYRFSISYSPSSIAIDSNQKNIIKSAQIKDLIKKKKPRFAIKN